METILACNDIATRALIFERTPRVESTDHGNIKTSTWSIQIDASVQITLFHEVAILPQSDVTAVVAATAVVVVVAVINCNRRSPRIRPVPAGL